MAGEHLDIIRINNKNPENQRLYSSCSLRVIFIYWDNEFHAVRRIWRSDLGRVWISSKSSSKTLSETVGVGIISVAISGGSFHSLPGLLLGLQP